MNLFFSNIDGSIAILNESETHHLNKVLRLKLDEKVLVTDGQGKMYVGFISQINKKETLITIDSEKDTGLIVPQLEIAFAPTKSNDRSEVLIEKAVELGARNIYPIITYHSERRKINCDRWQKIADSAMKQSLKPYRCFVHELQNFSNFIKSKKDYKNIYIAHCNDQFKTKLAKNVLTKGNENLVLIGPEGDFSTQEIEAAIEIGCTSISFGNQRLRTETAGIYFAAVHNFINT